MHLVINYASLDIWYEITQDQTILDKLISEGNIKCTIWWNFKLYVK